MHLRKTALVCCSNALKPEMKDRIEFLRQELLSFGIDWVLSLCMFSDQPRGHGDGRRRAEEMMRFYLDPDITEIYDVSGGDLSNEILPYLDYDVIRENPKPFYGYSDLTTVLNGIYTKTGREGILYQVRNLISESREEQRRLFGTEGLFEIPLRFLRGSEMSGVVVGGNIRCFLKLAGTEYFPDLEGKILLLEARGGEVPQMVAYLSQLEQLGAFKKVRGILLGTFTKMEQLSCKPSMEELVLSAVPDDIPVAKTGKVGHGTDSRAVRIGGFYRFSEEKLEVKTTEKR